MSQLYDLSPISYENWLRLVFDHPTEENSLWTWQGNNDFEVSDVTRLVAHMTRLCHEFKTVASTYSLEQIDAGIWFLLCGEIHFGEYLATPSIQLSLRLDCVRAMLHVYADFVAVSEVEVMENCFDMWWDSLCGDFWNTLEHRIEKQQPRSKKKVKKKLVPKDELPPHFKISYDNLGDDEKRVVDVMFETLTAILALNDFRTKTYALHGLGHLHHPNVPIVVQNFIDTEAPEEGWEDEGLKWLEECRDGTVM